MIALFFLFLTLSVSPFKSKSRLEAENAALRHQLIVLQRRVLFGRRAGYKGEAGHPDLGTAEGSEDPRLETSGFMAEAQNVKPKPA